MKEEKLTHDQAMGMAWWNNMSEAERAEALAKVQPGASVADAWEEFKAGQQRFDSVINRVVFTDAEMKRQRQELRENWKILQAWAEEKGKKIDLRHM